MAPHFHIQTIAADARSRDPDLDVIVLDPTPSWVIDGDGLVTRTGSYTGLVLAAERRGRRWVGRLLAELRLPRA